MSKLVWYCPKCNDVQVSDSEEHHMMNVCKCGLTGIDLEEYGMRIMGTEPIVPIKLAECHDTGLGKFKWVRKRK